MTDKKKIACNAGEILGLGIDPLKGFFYEGNLADPVMQRIVPNMVRLVKILTNKKCRHVIVADSHRRGDEELTRLPEHCMEGTSEAEVIDELKGFNSHVIEKRTTNSFIGTGLIDYLLGATPRVVVVYGVCSDICVMQAVITLSNFADKIGLEKIIVPMDCVTTFGVDARTKDKYAFEVLGNVPKVVVIPSYRNIGEAVEIK